MSFAAKVEKLMFTVGLTDKTAGPVGNINARVEKLANNAQKGFRNVGYGIAGITGAIFALNRAMAPAIEQQRALNEVASLDVEPKALKQLNRMALVTQSQFGTASAEIIRSAYNIQSSISGLNGDELSKFTKNSAILAKGTKADANTITDFMGTMFGIFKNEAEIMGKSAWVDQLTGQTATAVQMFKTTGVEMNSAFKSLGAEGQAAKISMNEQMAVLGQLQSTMSGSEAGTKYKSFIQNVGRAQNSLGLKFTDSAGRMLPIVSIMEKIKGKYGQIDTVSKSDAIKNAFGSDEAVALVKLLVSDTGTLAQNIDALGDVRGMEKAIKMAKKMTDPWQKLAGTTKSIHTVFSQALVPVLQPTIDKLTEAGETLIVWTEMFPTLTKVVAATGMAIVGLIAAVALLTVAVGIYRFLAVGMAVIHGVWAVAMLVVASPILAIIAGLAAMAVGVYALIYVWDKFKDRLGIIVMAAKIQVTRLKQWFDSINIFEMWLEHIDGLIEKLNYIPGIDIDTRFSSSSNSSSPKPFKSPNGSIGSQIRQWNTQNSGMHIEQVTIKTDGIDGAQSLQEKLWIQAG